MGKKIHRVAFHTYTPSKNSNVLDLIPIDVRSMINPSLIVALSNGIPNKVWIGKEVSYVHLRVFGCRIFVQHPQS